MSQVFIWVKLKSTHEVREVRLKVAQAGCVADIFEALVESNSDLKVRDLVCVAKKKGSNNEQEIGPREDIETLDPDSINIVVKMLNFTATPQLTSRSTTVTQSGKRCPQNDISKLIEAAEKEDIKIRIEENDPSEPIHDNTSSGGIGKFNTQRTEFNLHHTDQFYLENASELGIKHVNHYHSEDHPLSIAVTWQELALLDIAHAVENIQNCNYNYTQHAICVTFLAYIYACACVFLQ